MGAPGVSELPYPRLMNITSEAGDFVVPLARCQRADVFVEEMLGAVVVGPLA